MNLEHVKEPPTKTFWMGTDALGRDLRARFLLGGAISLSIGLASALIAILIGTAVGVIAGYIGGRLDAALMRTVDLLYSLRLHFAGDPHARRPGPRPSPTFLTSTPIPQNKLHRLHLLRGGVTGQKSASQWANMLVLLVGIGSVSWLTLARVIRGQVLSLRDQPFVEAARALGFGRRRIITRHILPNLIGTIVVYGALTVPAAILSESFLSFLGLGIQPPLPSWGNLASDGTEALNPVHVRWWLITWPCLGLSLALLCLNFLGDGIREALDVRSQK